MNKETFRFSGMRKDGVLVESNNIEDFKLQDFTWFQETSMITKEQYEKMKHLKD